MPHTRNEMLNWAKAVWEKISGHPKEVTYKGWLARDENKVLHLYGEKPRKGGHAWLTKGNNLSSIGGQLAFHLDRLNVNWEDAEPTPCEITIKTT